MYSCVGFGWNHTSFDFFEPELGRLGLSEDPTDEPPKQTQLWARVRGKADRDILERVPSIANSPTILAKPFKRHRTECTMVSLPPKTIP